jgi:molecular chaperone GrpE
MIQIIPLVDNFDAAFSNKELWESVSKDWRIGIEYIYSQFLKTLEENGVERYGSTEDIFDPLLHNPVAVEEVEENQEGKILEIIQVGYKMGDLVLREAKVKIGKKKEN